MSSGSTRSAPRIKPAKAGWRRHRLLIQFAEYMVGGGVYFWGGMAVFALLFDGVHSSWWSAKVTADIFGWSANYFIQRYWAFTDPRLKGQERRVVFRYVLVNVVDLVIDYFIVWSFVHNGITPYAGFFVSAGFTTVWDYLWYRFWVFKPAS